MWRNYLYFKERILSLGKFSIFFFFFFNRRFFYPVHAVIFLQAYGLKAGGYIAVSQVGSQI